MKRIFFLLFLQMGLISILSAQVNNEPEADAKLPCSKQPKAINLADIQKKISYPPIAREMNLEGCMSFRVLIDENGCYVKHLPARTGHPILIKEFEKYLPELQFEPATLYDKPIKFWVNVPFTICLQ